MKTLVVGNGFDIGHGLKTKYSDFIDFLKGINDIESEDEKAADIKKLCENNAFLKYILHEEDINKDFWTDLEELLYILCSEIDGLFSENQGKINQEGEIKKRELTSLDNKILSYFSLIDEFGSGIMDEICISDEYYSLTYGPNWKNLKNYLIRELDGLKKALVLYLKYFMPQKSSKDKMLFRQVLELQPDYIISFNYTKTFDRYSFSNCKTFNIHGDLDSEKVVLGFDDRDPDNIRLIDFKKYFQRIKYKLPSIYQDGILPVESFDESTVFFYGLSLDKKDEDVIKELIEHYKNSIIFYCESVPYDYEQKVKNLIDLLGKEKALRYMAQYRVQFCKIDEEIIDGNRNC